MAHIQIHITPGGEAAENLRDEMQGETKRKFLPMAKHKAKVRMSKVDEQIAAIQRTMKNK